MGSSRHFKKTNTTKNLHVIRNLPEYKYFLRPSFSDILTKGEWFAISGRLLTKVEYYVILLPTEIRRFLSNDPGDVNAADDSR